MAKLIFKHTDPDYIRECRESSEVELNVPDDMNIMEFKLVCKRLASAMGYHQTNIDSEFGIDK